MRKFLSILMLACLLCGLALPAGAEETCTKTEGCTLADGHEDLCNALCSKTKGCTQYGGHEGECTLPCSETKNCTKANGHEGLCDAMCDKTDGCLMYGGHAGDCVPELMLGSDADINGVLGSKDALIGYLETKYTNYHYTGGDITLKLAEPESGYGDVTVLVALDGGTLTLKGSSGTKINSLTIGKDNICAEGITFSGNPAVTVNAVSSFEATNCSFPQTGVTFRLNQTNEKITPVLKLNRNSFPGGCNVNVWDGSSRVGSWISALSSNKTEPMELDLGVIVTPSEENENGTQIVKAIFSSDVAGYASKGWKYTFNALRGFDSDKAYAVHDYELVSNDTFALATTDNKEKLFKIVSPEKGEYCIVVDGVEPKVVNNKVSITADHALYLKDVTVDTTYANATVSLGNTKVPAAVNNKKLTFSLNGKGTYTIAEIKTTTTTTTTKTTSRSYNYKYQDYYLITPQRVTDCMRYAKDNLVTIECKEAGRRSISLPVASMAAAAEKGYSILLKNEKIADITMDAAALKSLAQQAKGTTVLLHYRSLNHKTLTSVGLASVQSHLDQFPNDNADLAFLLTATSDSETIEDLQLGTITLKIPFIVLPGTEEMKNEVYALQSETAASARETTVADGHLTTKLTDLTEHMVFQIGEPVETTEETTEPTVETTVETTQPETEPETVPETTAAPEPEEEGKGFPIWIPIVAVLLLGGGGGAAAWFLYFRKRFKK